MSDACYYTRRTVPIQDVVDYVDVCLCIGYIMKQFRQAAHKVRYRQQSIHLREKNIVGPTEKSVNANAFT